MRDAIDARLWADHGHQFSDQVAKILGAAMTALHSLAAIEFGAPWRETSSHC